MKNYQIILMSVISFAVAYGILSGSIPSHYFAGELNELGCGYRIIYGYVIPIWY